MKIRLILAAATFLFGSTVQASILTFEEVGNVPADGIYYFESVGDFNFETIRCNCPNPGNHQGVGLLNAVDAPDAYIRKFYNTPKNVVRPSHDIDIRMTHNSGGVFDLLGMYMGHSHFQSPTLYLDGYLGNSLVYEMEVTFPNIPSDAMAPALQFVALNMMNIDRVEWSLSHVNIGLSVMDSYTYNLSPVPVPAAIWLFGTALVGLVGFGRRRKAAPPMRM
jgi:hypothetical protein